MTLKATEPKGMRVNPLAKRLYAGKPAGWLIPSVKAVLTISGESLWKIVGQMVARYSDHEKIVKKKPPNAFELSS